MGRVRHAEARASGMATSTRQPASDEAVDHAGRAAGLLRQRALGADEAVGGDRRARACGLASCAAGGGALRRGARRSAAWPARRRRWRSSSCAPPCRAAPVCSARPIRRTAARERAAAATSSRSVRAFSFLAIDRLPDRRRPCPRRCRCGSAGRTAPARRHRARRSTSPGHQVVIGLVERDRHQHRHALARCARGVTVNFEQAFQCIHCRTRAGSPGSKHIIS